MTLGWAMTAYGFRLQPDTTQSGTWLLEKAGVQRKAKPKLRGVITQRPVTEGSEAERHVRHHYSQAY